MVLLSIFFTRESDPRGITKGICSLSILSLHALALHLAVKILLQIFLYEDLTRWPYIHLSVVFPPECQWWPHFVTQPILLSENIPNIWHKSSTKHKVRSDWNDKNDNANYAPRITWKVLPMAQVAIFKEHLIKCERFDCTVLFWTKNVAMLHIIFTI